MNYFNIDRSKPFKHRGRHGTKMESDQCDLLGKVVLHRPSRIADAQFAADVAEIIGWWTVNIYSEFVKDGKGYPGFDVIEFEVIHQSV